jgi:transaldolase
MLSRLQTIGQSLWIDHATREVIYDGSLLRHIEEWSVTGVSLSPQAVCQTLARTTVYDRVITKKIKEGMCGERLAFDLILEDVRHAADLLRHVFDKTDGVDGWVTLPASPLKIGNSEELQKSVTELHSQIKRPNVLITVPGLPEHSELITEFVYAGIPLNISLICSHDQYIDAAEGYLRGVEKRINAGLNPAVTAFVSIPGTQLAEILSKKMTHENATRVTIAVARKIYGSMRRLHTSQKWERAYNTGGRLLRLIWVNSVDEQTTIPDHDVSNHLLAPLTVTSMSSSCLNEFVSSEEPLEVMPENGDDCNEILARAEEGGLDVERIVTRLQRELTERQVKTWIMLLDVLAQKSASIIQNSTKSIKENNYETLY